ncbi:unnamed protein product [Oppiella nova]|uniref:Uncharacterized protein n=1 Tax=Oppiella nova TaxID=334625 RepID=A0A7R9MAA4_9ACAR|nr:unnamed protein product [Oppiella nova]CAG2173173.1 unnamed protein product [Oppiella nova]
MSIHLSDLLDSICHDLDKIGPNSFIVDNSVKTITDLTIKLKKSKTLFIRIQQMVSYIDNLHICHELYCDPDTDIIK